MKALRIICLSFIIWGLPSFLLAISNEDIGSKSSYAMFILLLIYYFLEKKNQIVTPFIVLGVCYFMISGLVYHNNTEFFLYDFSKYIILVLAGAEICRNLKLNTILLMLAIGACSVVIHALLFQDLYGRYSGFYLNPNAAGFICLSGYCLSFYLKQERIKYFALALFSFAGFLTFSRYFILIWLVVTLVSVFIKRKNLIVFGIGVSSIIVLISLSAILQLNTERYAAIDEILNNQFDKGLTIFMTDSRQENWSEYYDQILDHPFFGTGYQKLMGYDGRKQGVHNAYLLTIGEAGLIPFLILIFIFFRLFKTGFLRISEVPHYFLMTVAISSYFLTSHNFYDYFPGLFILLLIYIKLHEEHVELEKSDADSLIITPSKT